VKGRAGNGPALFFATALGSDFHIDLPAPFDSRTPSFFALCVRTDAQPCAPSRRSFTCPHYRILQGLNQRYTMYFTSHTTAGTKRSGNCFKAAAKPSPATWMSTLCMSGAKAPVEIKGSRGRWKHSMGTSPQRSRKERPRIGDTVLQKGGKPLGSRQANSRLVGWLNMQYARPRHRMKQNEADDGCVCLAASTDLISFLLFSPAGVVFQQ
jgi:hypothetical protein